MDLIFINFADSKTSDSHRLLLTLLDKINLKRNNKYYQVLGFTIHGKRQTKSYK